jgi:hypothetical protein
LLCGLPVGSVVIAVDIGNVVDHVCLFLHCFYRLAPDGQRLLSRTEVTLGEYAFTRLSKACRAACGFSSASSSTFVFGGLGIITSLATHRTVCIVCSSILARTFVIHPFSDVHTLFTLAIVEIKAEPSKYEAE